MKKLLALLIVLTSCSIKEKEWPYEIKGNVETENGPHPAIWHTDTIYFKGDTVCYDNSDGSIVKIAPPYEIRKN
jgi:hypothetical protein